MVLVTGLNSFFKGAIVEAAAVTGVADATGTEEGFVAGVSQPAEDFGSSQVLPCDSDPTVAATEVFAQSSVVEEVPQPDSACSIIPVDLLLLGAPVVVVAVTGVVVVVVVVEEGRRRFGPL